MPRIRSLVTTVRIDVAQRAHDCQANGNHRLSKGDRRLGVKKDRSWDNYALASVRRILQGDAAKTASLLRAFTGDGLVAGDEG